jgi:hypothetical protein
MLKIFLRRKEERICKNIFLRERRKESVKERRKGSGKNC